MIYIVKMQCLIFTFFGRRSHKTTGSTCVKIHQLVS